MFNRQLYLTHGPYFPGTKNIADYEDVRVIQMDKNQTRLLDAFRDMHVKRGLPMDDFDELARKIVYGGAHTVTKPD
jgi:hypothetical protein